MLQSRSPFRTHAKNLSNSPSPSSRLGRLFLPFGRNSVMPSLGSNLLLRPVELGSVDPHAMQNDRKLTRDRNLGLAQPVALGEPYPQAFRQTILGRASAELRLLQTDNFATWRRHTSRCGLTNRLLRRHGAYWLTRHKHLRFSTAQTAPNPLVRFNIAAAN